MDYTTYFLNGELVANEHSWRGKGNSLNLSSIATILIQNVGRFVERYASDFLIDWKNVEELSDPTEIQPGDDNIVIFAMRRDGVDHASFFEARLRERSFPPYYLVSPSEVYRKVMAVRVVCDSEGRIEVELRDISDVLFKIQKEAT